MTGKRFIIVYNEQCKMMQYVDTQKEELDRWAIWNVNETLQKMNDFADENEHLKKENKIMRFLGKTALKKIQENTVLMEENEQLKTFLEALREELSLADRDNTTLEKENEQLKQQLNDFEFEFTQNFVTESNDDKLYIKDTHTKIDAKDGIMWITVFIPRNNEIIKIKYRISKQDVMREYLKLKGIGK